MKIKSFANYTEMTGDAYVMDYTEASKNQPKESQRKVCITDNVPTDISYFHLINPRKIAYWAVNFEENTALLKGSDQCECMFASSKSKVTSKGWICLVELKYCLEKNIDRNSRHAFKQLYETLEKLMELQIIDLHSHRVYLNISIPEHSDREPFTAFQNTQDELLSILEKHKVKLLGYNKALILNEGFIKLPKENI